jgi:Uma2 family endonuclease
MSIQVIQPEDNRIEIVGGDTPQRVLLEITLSPCEPPAVKRKMTYEEFLDWADEDTLAEWVRGEAVMTSPASLRHQLLVEFLMRIMADYVDDCDLGLVLVAPFQMKLENGREPDLLFVRQEHRDRLHETYLDGPADLVVEIVSPESVGRDRGDKFYEYAEGGVPEYWLIDPQRQRADFYRLKEGEYVSLLAGKQGKYTSQALAGFWLQVEWLWQDPLPSVRQVLEEIRGVDL